MKLEGVFFRELASESEPGVIHIEHKTASIFCGGSIICENIEIASVQSRQNIYLRNGYLFVLSQPLDRSYDKFYLSKVSLGLSWLEGFSIVKAIILSLLLIVMLFVFRILINNGTDLIVKIFPKQWEEKIGRNTYDLFKRGILDDSNLSLQTKSNLRNKTKKIVIANGLNDSEIFFHDTDMIGPNALAFAGGPIVITDDLVGLLQDDKLVLAVIAHELAHVHMKHSLQQIAELIGFLALVSILLGSNDTVFEEASAVGLNLLMSKKSRDHEKEADLLAQEYLQTAGIDKNSLSVALKKLRLYTCKSNLAENCLKSGSNNWFSSHPSVYERLKYLKSEK